jgi:hypothetical protein
MLHPKYVMQRDNLLPRQLSILAEMIVDGIFANYVVLLGECHVRWVLAEYVTFSSITPDGPTKD